MTSVRPQRPEPDPTIMDALADVLVMRFGLVFDGSRRSELASKAAEAFARSGSRSWEEYLDRLTNGGADGNADDLLTRLAEAVTVGETYFFRHRPHFDFLERVALPEIIERRRPTRQLRIWSAGCATGEEVYSLAILARRALVDIDDWHVQVIGTDLNQASLRTADAGVYGEWSFREMDEAFKAAHFLAEGTHYRIRPEYRRLVQIRCLNLAGETYPSLLGGLFDVDLILCRNVFIYLSPAIAQQVMARLRLALVPGGWLGLGPNDLLSSQISGFDQVIEGDAVFYRRTDVTVPESPALHGTLAATPLVAPPRATTRTGTGQTPSPAAPAGTALATPAAELRSVSQTVTVDKAPSERDQPRHPAHPGQDLVDLQAQTGPGGALGPGRLEPLYRAARAKAAQGDAEGAESLVRQLLSQGAPGPEPYFFLGLLREAQGDDVAAQVAFRQALYCDRAFVPAHFAVAVIHRRHGRAALARGALERVNRLLADRAAEDVLLTEDGMTVGGLRRVAAEMLDALL